MQTKKNPTRGGRRRPSKAAATRLVAGDWIDTSEHAIARVAAERQLVVDDFEDPLVLIGRIRFALGELEHWREHVLDEHSTEERRAAAIRENETALTEALYELEHVLTFAEDLEAFELLSTARRGVELGLRVEQHDDTDVPVAIGCIGADVRIRYRPLDRDVQVELAAAIAVASSRRSELAVERKRARNGRSSARAQNDRLGGTSVRSQSYPAPRHGARR